LEGGRKKKIEKGLYRETHQQFLLQFLRGDTEEVSGWKGRSAERNVDNFANPRCKDGGGEAIKTSPPGSVVGGVKQLFSLKIVV